MNDKALKWLQQSSEYGVDTTNSAHDINNALAILMGYTENLEYMVETDKIDKKELQEICDKLFFGIDKLNANSRAYAESRKRKASESRSQDFSDYFHRWTKATSPILRQLNIIPNFVTGDEFTTEQNWSEVNIELCELFSSLFDIEKLDEPTKIEFYLENNGSSLILKISNTEHWNLSAPSTFLGKKVNFSQDTEFYQLHFTCFSNEASTISAA